MPTETQLIEEESRAAEHGEKMVVVTLRFWTNKIAPREGEIIPKHINSSGVARVLPNAAHGIEPVDPVPFNSFAEIGAVIEDLFIEHGIKVHPDRNKMRKYISAE